jgi:glucose-1-phosphate cytidylyltransferase
VILTLKQSTTLIENTPIFILAGGLGTRLKEHTDLRPKPMIEIGHKPMLWHIMNAYAAYGFRKFVICAGFKSETIKDYFLNYDALNSDLTVNLFTREVRYHQRHHDQDWEVTVAYTGELAMTGARLAHAARKYLGAAESFGVTYGDGLCDADLAAEFRFHEHHGRIGTMLAIHAPPSRFGQLVLDVDRVVHFAEKPETPDAWINGGYFFFRRSFLEYLSPEEDCILEKEPLANLTSEGELTIFRHDGFWACMDTQRDKDHLEELWEGGQAPWVPRGAKK